MGHVPIPVGKLKHSEGDETHAEGEGRHVAGLLEVGGVGGALGDAAGVLKLADFLDLKIRGG